MRKITASLYMTLDGRGAFPKYPGSDRETTGPNEMWREMWLNRFDDVTTVIMGRRSFLGHRRVWTEKARKPTDQKYLIDYSRWLDHVDKVCLSSRLKSPGWENSRIMKGDLSKIVAKLKREKGGTSSQKAARDSYSSSSGGGWLTTTGSSCSPWSTGRVHSTGVGWRRRRPSSFSRQRPWKTESCSCTTKPCGGSALSTTPGLWELRSLAGVSTPGAEAPPLPRVPPDPNHSPLARNWNPHVLDPSEPGRASGQCFPRLPLFVPIQLASTPLRPIRTSRSHLRAARCTQRLRNILGTEGRRTGPTPTDLWNFG